MSIGSRRLSAIAFGLLAVATIVAFFLVQHLKVSNPLVWHEVPVPNAIDPVHGRTCVTPAGEVLNHRHSRITIKVSHADTVGVYIVSAKDPNGAPVATINSGMPMKRNVGRIVSWNGQLDNGKLASAGTYYFRVVLQHEGRSINPPGAAVHVLRRAPQTRVTSVKLVGAGSSTSAGGSTSTGPAVISPPDGSVRISWSKGSYRRIWLNVYRTDVVGKPRLVAQLQEKTRHPSAVWNGKIDGRPVPAGTYLIGVTAQNMACVQSTWPVVVPLTAGITPGAGVTIRYLSVAPPLAPTISGSSATVIVDSPDAGFTWTLRHSGGVKVLAHGAGSAGERRISVPMPKQEAGLYTLVIRSGTQSTAVPLVEYRAGSDAAKARVLVVIPMLSWVGNSPVDDTGDGLPDTLARGEAVSLERPLADGLPASLDDDAALLRYLDKQGLSYQLTTDVALAQGVGPSLVNRWGVLFADGEQFLPSGLASSLSSYVKAGGRVATLGVNALKGTSRISGFPSDPQAAAPATAKTDLFGVQHGPLTSTGGALITTLADQLSLLGDATAFSSFREYQPLEPPAGAPVSAAGIADGSPAVIAFRDGRGAVVEVGLPNFGASLAGDINAQVLMNAIWGLVGKSR